MSESPSPSTEPIAVVDDLIFATKIRSTAQSLGGGITILKTLDRFDQLLKSLRPPLVIVDLSASAFDPMQAVSVASAHPTRPFVLAYVAHVDKELADRATQAGAQAVLPRSRFARELPDWLGRYIAT